MDNSNIANPKPSQLVVYSTSWCPDAKRSKALLDIHNIDYLDIDIEKNNDAYIFIEKLTQRVRIPTIIFPDGSILIEPNDELLSKQLGVV